MIQKIHNFYLKKGVFIFFAIASMVGWLVWSVTTVISGNPIKLCIFGFIFFLLTGGITWSYIKGETNIQKLLFGSLLIFLIIDYIEIVDVYVSINYISSVITMAIALVILIVFYICHLLQQLDHTGKSIIVVINQCCGLITLVSVVFLIINLITSNIVLTDCTFCASVMFTMQFTICIETRISKYKQIRATHKANGAWDEIARAEAKKIFKLS